MKLGILKSLGLGACAFFAFGQAANADQVKYVGFGLGTHNIPGVPTASGGGEFNFQVPAGNFTGAGFVFNPTGGDIIKTFCLELQEHIILNTTYDATISGTTTTAGRAYAGGLGTTGIDGNGVYDAISVRTAYIFKQFEGARTYNSENSDIIDVSATQWKLVSNSTTYNLNQLADATQLAIWASEDELVASALATSYTGGAIGELAKALYDAGTNWVNLGNTGFQNVRVLNLTENGQLRQSQLVLSSSNVGPPPAPLPGIAVAGFACFGGLGGLQIVRRRRRMA